MEFKQICKKLGGKLTRKGTCKLDGFNMDKADYLFKFRPKTQKVILMDTDLFLANVPQDPFKDRKRTERLKRKIKTSSMDPLYLDVDIDTCRIQRHEGRGRATASRELGIKKIPVILYFEEDGRPIEVEGKKLKCENQLNLKRQKEFK